ncbi:hypothetical protein BJX96DRAFT_180135 [Aspergillus floccosus]
MASSTRGSQVNIQGRNTSTTVQGKSGSQKHAISPEAIPTRDDIQGLDWDQLQEVYIDAMQEHGKAEEEVKNQTSDLLKIFTAWSETTLVRDETRALKRQVYSTVQGFGQYYLTTAQVQNTNATYTNVVKAFESALALLNNRVNH